MRWENLFDDLAGQLEHELDAEEIDVRGEEERLRLGRLTVRDRLVALHEARAGSADGPLRVELVNGERLRVVPRSIGRDWLMGDLSDERGRPSQCVVPLPSIAALSLDRELVEPSTASPPALRLADRLGLTFVLRDLARRRRAVELHVGSSILHGTIDRVGRDHLDLAEHEAGTPRRDNAVAAVRLVPLDRLSWVRL